MSKTGEKSTPESAFPSVFYKGWANKLRFTGKISHTFLYTSKLLENAMNRLTSSLLSLERGCQKQQQQQPYPQHTQIRNGRKIKAKVKVKTTFHTHYYFKSALDLKVTY